ncbi:inner membrane protein YhjD [Corynebacterium freiburgense]|uniref:inner membrane protein YhjD n=1 Tax=Corynebacterium freiburgense TaxID=556548 RepID=UPI0004036EA8|nr:inner membrane protein YhjD [Corynebacterium freiburgense]WJZ01817.1 Inner membrane protein YhjD [Corynebacterium freiburgense]
MAATTQTRRDEFGIERVSPDKPGFVDRYRQQWPWFDHVMRMHERYVEMGGSQYAAGITYFSVLSMFPILMLAFAGIAFALANRPEMVVEIQEQIAAQVSGDVADPINTIVETAISQRGAVAGVGAATALWSGLAWMYNLRYGVSKMWKFDPHAGNFLRDKLKDLLGLVGLLVAFVFAFGITAVGSSGLAYRIVAWIGADDIPGIFTLLWFVSLILGVLANYVVFFWLIKYMPRVKVPPRSALKAAWIGAIGFELFKQVASLFFASALTNPAGATFGPIIGVMVLLYFIWQILLYCSAWAATTEESLAQTKPAVPEPAVIRVRQEIRVAPSPRSMATAAAAGAAATAVIARLFRRPRG